MNRTHKRTRKIVERGIGELKRRFHVLRGEVRLSPQKTCQAVVACTVLHNICKDRQIPNPGGDPESYNEDANMMVMIFLICLKRQQFKATMEALCIDNSLLRYNALLR